MNPSDASSESMKAAPLSAMVPPAAASSRSIVVKEYDFFKVVQDYLDRAARTIETTIAIPPTQ